MYEVNIAQQLSGYERAVIRPGIQYEWGKRAGFRQNFPDIHNRFPVTICLSADKRIAHAIKAVLLDHSIQLSRIKYDFSGFDIVLALDRHRDMGGLSALLPDFRSGTETFWRILWIYTKETGQKEAFKNFLVMFRIYMQAIADDLSARNPGLHLSASSASPDLERYLSEMDPVV
jgi:hypothetical protein